MIRVLEGQDLDALVEAWAPRHDDPFAPLEIIAPSRLVEARARSVVAARHGIAAMWRVRRLGAWLEEHAHDGRLATPPRLLLGAVQVFREDVAPDGFRRFFDAAASDDERRRRWLQTAERWAAGVYAAFAEQTDPDLENDVRALYAAVAEREGLVSLPEALARGLFRRPGPPLHLIDPGAARPMELQAVGQAGDARPFCILALNPCREFWEDLPRRPDAPDEHPLLVSWGQGGRAGVKWLHQMADPEARHRRPADSVLGRLQADVLARRAPSSAERRDRSIVLRSFAHPRDEARFVAAQIEARMTENAQLSLSEIGVAIAGDDGGMRDALAAALIDIPHHHADASVGPASRVFDLAERLMRVPEQGYSGEALRGLVVHPNFATDLEPDQRTDAAGWIASSGMIEGLGRTGLGWRHGAARLAFGLLSHDPAVGLATRDPAGVGLWLGDVRRLTETYEALAGERSPRAWGRALRHMLLTHVRALDEADERDLGWLLGMAADHDDPRTGWTWRMMVDAWSKEMTDLRRRSSGGGVVIGRLSALAALPLEVAFVVQLDERRFPRRSPPTPFGLPGPGLAEQDRWSLLTRLMATRSAFIGTCSGETPSLPLSELADVVQARIEPGPPRTIEGGASPTTELPDPMPRRTVAFHHLLTWLVDPFTAWLDVHHGPAPEAPRPIGRSFGLERSREREVLQTLLATCWPAPPNRDQVESALEEARLLNPSTVPEGLYLEAERVRLLRWVEDWVRALDRAEVPRAPLTTWTAPTLRFGAFELGPARAPVVDADEEHWTRVELHLSAHPPVALPRCFAHHARRCAERSGTTVHVALAGVQSERQLLRPVGEDESRTWLAHATRSLLEDRAPHHLPFGASWALLRERGAARPELERRWDRVRWRHGPSPSRPVEVPPLAEALDRIEAKLGLFIEAVP